MFPKASFCPQCGKPLDPHPGPGASQTPCGGCGWQPPELPEPQWETPRRWPFLVLALAVVAGLGSGIYYAFNRVPQQELQTHKKTEGEGAANPKPETEDPLSPYKARYQGKTAFEAETIIQDCWASRSMLCAEAGWRYIVTLKPKDPKTLGSLGIVLAQQEKYQEAQRLLETSIELGGVAYDLFSWKAKTLEGLGNAPGAIEWYARAFAMVPRLVDVLQSLTQLLIGENRAPEAYSFLMSLVQDQSPIANYAKQLLVGVEAALARHNSSPSTGTKAALTLLRTGSHYAVPIAFEDGKFNSFMFDTGDSISSLPDSLAKTLVAEGKGQWEPGEVKFKVADGRVVKGRIVKVNSVDLGGGIELKNIRFGSCKGCLFLFGQEDIGKFDVKTQKWGGAERLTLTLR